MSTRDWTEGWQTDEANRPRWWIENAGFNELKEGWLLERYPWGRSEAIVRGRVGFPLLAQQVVALYCQAAGRQLVGDGIRRLRRALNLALGGPGLVVVVEDCDAVLPVAELLAALGHPVTRSLRRPVAGVRPDARRRAGVRGHQGRSPLRPHTALGRAAGSVPPFGERSRPESSRPSVLRSRPTDRGESAGATLIIHSIAAFSPRATPYPSAISKSLPDPL